MVGQSSHKPHKVSFVKVHYPWHPLYNQEIQVINTVNRGGDTFYSVRLSDTSTILIPCWMTDDVYCQRFTVRKEAFCSVQALLRLRQLLDSVGK